MAECPSYGRVAELNVVIFVQPCLPLSTHSPTGNSKPHGMDGGFQCSFKQGTILHLLGEIFCPQKIMVFCIHMVHNVNIQKEINKPENQPIDALGKRPEVRSGLIWVVWLIRVDLG